MKFNKTVWQHFCWQYDIQHIKNSTALIVGIIWTISLASEKYAEHLCYFNTIYSSTVLRYHSYTKKCLFYKYPNQTHSNSNSNVKNGI